MTKQKKKKKKKRKKKKSFVHKGTMNHHLIYLNSPNRVCVCGGGGGGGVVEGGLGESRGLDGGVVCVSV